MVDNALRWFSDFHVDALRLDAVHELKDDSDQHVLAQLSDEVAALSARLGRPLDLIAESDLNDPRTVTPTADGGQGMDAQWDDDIHHALHVMLTGETQGYYADFAGHCAALPDGGPLAVLAKTMTSAFLHDGRWSSFRDAEWGAPVDRRKVDGRRFLAYLQTHDQVGNRALGDRISAVVTPGRQAIGAALYLTGPFTPMVFMGEEWAATTPFQFFTDFDEPAMKQAVTAGRRREFEAHGWAAEDVPDPQDEQTYRRSQLDWAELHEGEHARMFAWYRDLIALRRSEFDLGNGSLESVAVDFDEGDGWFVVRRGAFRVVANLAESRWTVPLDAEPESVVLAWEPDADPPARSRRAPAAVHRGGRADGSVDREVVGHQVGLHGEPVVGGPGPAVGGPGDPPDGAPAPLAGPGPHAGEERVDGPGAAVLGCHEQVVEEAGLRAVQGPDERPDVSKANGFRAGVGADHEALQLVGRVHQPAPDDLADLVGAGGLVEVEVATVQSCPGVAVVGPQVVHDPPALGSRGAACRPRSGLLDADHALLGDGRDEGAVGGEHPADPEPTPARGRG